ncbi:hypothetical protein [Pseudaminobacter soli (ex Li et al. 2025)]|uniref:Uncharacterized protein n=1 Tax=Pseudaminobacter soli (ex Li et al. 2025) TaxID=1295366 RepID=A0A2P7S9X5_9HYPH|nr:hypothetical protein [Mesorhizobium soli]PSJ59298.1 hypothetical protein C7I85_16945 [Mesorhizobium soli]
MDELPTMNKRAARKAAETRSTLIGRGEPLPRSLSDAIVLAGSIAATLQGAHLRCQRRECRNQKRCCSALEPGKELGCDVPLPVEITTKMMAGMLVFAQRLAEGVK